MAKYKEINFEDSFESLSQEEWSRYLGSDLFDEMSLDVTSFNVNSNRLNLREVGTLCLEDLIFEHNNKVVSLRATYALCRHYFDKGIPDDPWYISPGENGQSIQYMPKFREEHWGRQYWFNYFANTFYIRISALWDSVLEIINHYYEYDFPDGQGLRNKIFKHLQEDEPALAAIFNSIQNDALYKAAQKYRIEAAHGTSAGIIHNGVKVQHDTYAEIPVTDEYGKVITIDGKVKMKTVPASTKVSFGAGEYINTETIMNNIEEYSKYTGRKIQEMVGCMRND